MSNSSWTNDRIVAECQGLTSDATRTSATLRLLLAGRRSNHNQVAYDLVLGSAHA